MAYVIKCVNLSGTVTRSLERGTPNGMFLESYDVEAYNGRGDAKWTYDMYRAMRFDNIVDAQQTWAKQSETRPLRDDGEPNKPLTAFTISIIPISQVGP